MRCVKGAAAIGGDVVSLSAGSIGPMKVRDVLVTRVSTVEALCENSRYDFARMWMVDYICSMLYNIKIPG